LKKRYLAPILIVAATVGIIAYRLYLTTTANACSGLDQIPDYDGILAPIRAMLGC